MSKRKFSESCDIGKVFKFDDNTIRMYQTQAHHSGGIVKMSLNDQLPRFSSSWSKSSCLKIVQNCPWSLERYDLFIEVESHLFPVHKSTLLGYPSNLREILRNRDNCNIAIISLNKYKLIDVKEMLTFIYSPYKRLCGKLCRFFFFFNLSSFISLFNFQKQHKCLQQF